MIIEVLNANRSIYLYGHINNSSPLLLLLHAFAVKVAVNLVQVYSRESMKSSQSWPLGSLQLRLVYIRYIVCKLLNDHGRKHWIRDSKHEVTYTDQAWSKFIVILKVNLVECKCVTKGSWNLLTTRSPLTALQNRLHEMLRTAS